MTVRLRSVAGRPVTDPRRTFVLVAVVLATVAGLLTLIANDPGHQPSQRAASTQPAASARVAPATPTPDRTSGSAPVASGSVQRTARRFLTGYLAYLYGHGTAHAIREATSTLRRRLAANPPRISPATRRRHPHVERLTIDAPSGAGRWRVTATISDGGVSTYPIALTLTQRPAGSVVVSDLREDR